MIHSGLLATSQFGKRVIVIIVSILCILFMMTSCELYSITYSKEDLQNDLVSIELVSIDGWDDNRNLLYTTLKIIETQDEQKEILQLLSEIEFEGTNGAGRSEYPYGFKLNYSDRFMIFTPSDIYWADEDQDVHSPGEGGSHRLYGYYENLQKLLAKYLPEDLKVEDSTLS